MKAGRINGRRASGPRNQQGVVLLIALIILVAMTLAGIGMMRSVDTGTVIAGNLAFRQTTLNAAEAGTSEAFIALARISNSGNAADKGMLELNYGQPCPAGATVALCTGIVNMPGYYPAVENACEINHTCPLASSYAWWTSDNLWTNKGIAVPALVDAYGKPIAAVSYVIHRMCSNSGAYNSGFNTCQTLVVPAKGCSKTQKPPCTTTSIFYRITSRAVGTRNSVSYTQTLVLISV